MSGLWTYRPEPPHFRIRLGGRLGLGISQSTRPASDVPYAPAYVLIRPRGWSLTSIAEVPFSTKPDEPLFGLHPHGGRYGGEHGVSSSDGELLAVGLTYGFDGPEMQR